MCTKFVYRTIFKGGFHMRESALEQRLTRGVQALGGICLKLVSPGRTGVPDRLIQLPDGRVIFAELKTETGRLAKIQAYQIAELRRRGADVRVLKGEADVDAFLAEVHG